MGVVYKARHVSTGRTVALKVLPPRLAANPNYIERFYREATAVCKLNHANIVQGIEVGKDKGHHFFAMEYVDGESVGAEIKRTGEIAEPRALQIALQAARGMQHAHSPGIVHRDIKPDNILLTRDGIAKLADLGIAREATNPHLTLAGATFGTPFYMSPEQARARRISTSAATSTLGATLYHMVTGAPPYSGDTALAVMNKHLTEAIPSSKEKNPNLSDSISQVIGKMMAKDPTARYQIRTRC